jgi:hypothetical protein
MGRPASGSGSIKKLTMFGMFKLMEKRWGEIPVGNQNLSQLR